MQSYDNSGYICEAYWVRGNTYFTQCEHEEVLPLVDMSENLSGFMIQGVEWISQDVEGFVAINLKSNLSKSSTGQDSRGQTAAAIAERDYLNPIEQGVIDVRFDNTSIIVKSDGGKEALFSWTPTTNTFLQRWMRKVFSQGSES